VDLQVSFDAPLITGYSNKPHLAKISKKKLITSNLGDKKWRQVA
jgi:hypothetical protein